MGIKPVRARNYKVFMMVAVLSLWWGSALAGSDTKVVSTKVVRTTDSQGNHVEKRITKKVRTRVVVDFEEASIEGRVKKPSAAYILHGAELDLKRLYKIRNNQHRRILTSYEYIR